MTSDEEWIKIRGARAHNLRGIDLDLPRGKFIVFTGVSGSGKTSLAFDTLFVEGQRRYIESLSPFARRFLDQLERPDADSITGLPPTLSVSQMSGARRSGPRSTVATLTEIHDRLRLLYARCGEVFCHNCGDPIGTQTLQDILRATESLPDGERIHILAPLVRGHKGKHRDEFLLIRREGFLRARLDGVLTMVDSPPDIDPNKSHDLEMVVDRQIVRPDIRQRLTESFQTALKFGNGTLIIAREEDGEWIDRVYSTRHACLRCDLSYPEIEPRTFSFYSPYGACQTCWGLGYVPATEPAAPADKGMSHDGDDEAPTVVCPACQGVGLGPIGRAVRLGGLAIHELTAQTVDAARDWIASLAFPPEKQPLAEVVLPEIVSRLDFLKRVGVGYIELDRPVSSLSGGEAQRIRLAGCVGSGLNGVLYVLDEPSIGLHPRDTQRLIEVLEELRDRDNTVLVVEHDEAIMRRADLLVDLGPGAGVLGGQIVNQGAFDAFLDGPGLTADYLSGRRAVGQSSPSAAAGDRSSSTDVALLTITGVSHHNLAGQSVSIPLGKLVCVTGVSGSGKSSLIVDVLTPAVRKAVLGNRGRPASASNEAPALFETLSGFERFDKVVEVDQSPIGRSPISTPASYTGLLDPIRQLFAKTKDAKIRGFTASRFSANNKAGQCPRCQGMGAIKVDLDFLPDLFVECQACRGRRFNRATLEVKFRGKTIADALALPVEQAVEFFENHPKIRPPLETLRDVGLGYLRLDQWATTLSGGEAQRVKLATELSKPGTGSTLFVLDEPTTGLHFHDVDHLLTLLRRLVAQGNSVIVIEHNLELIAAADWIIDMGPEGGAAGGRIVAEGTPAAIAQHPTSATGHALAEQASHHT